MFKRYLLLTGVAFTLSLAGCKSGVNLDDQYKDDGISSGQVTTVDGSGIDSQGGPSAQVSRTIYFDFDSYIVKDEFRSTINSHAQYLRANPSSRVVLEGHTDARGTSEYNLALGQKRSEAVRQALLILGVPEAQIEAVSYGKERPAVYGSDETAWAKNRRVEFSYR